ncbi:MAG TPA: DUF2442 domain-containing protein [Longimicrobium sp.]|jgi:hypothetical protein|uniref:DUF2442 domain-containing protein n=1 Tax=Longimicrobium sp. TaxID=2029185 RepID=UPI002ED91503
MSDDKRLTYEEILAQIPAAKARAKEADRTEPRARAATFDAATRRVRIELKDGCAFEFPADMAQGLRGVAAEFLAQVEVYPRGVGLRWTALDVDFSVPGLVARRFGGKAWMRQLEREMAEKESAARAEARRAPRTRKVEPEPGAGT